MRLPGALLLMALLASDAGHAQNADPCADIGKRFTGLIKRYTDAASAAIETTEPPQALEAARKAARGGDAGATVVIAGISFLFRPTQELFRLSEIRQICTFSERNGLRLHVVTCAYFNALNPLGEMELRRQAFDREVERHTAMPPGEGESEKALDADMKALEACILARPF